MRRSGSNRWGRGVVAAAAMALVVGLGVGELFAQTSAMDFSDTQAPMVQWPFEVIEYWTDDDGHRVFQHSRIKESPQEVFEYFSSLQASGSTLGKFHVMGLGQSATPNNYYIVLGEGNRRYQLHVKPDATGSELVIPSTPHARKGGYFKYAVYGYRLGADMRVGMHHYQRNDE